MSTKQNTSIFSVPMPDGDHQVTVRIKDTGPDVPIDSWTITDKDCKIRKHNGDLVIKFDIDPIKALQQFLTACPVTRLFDDDNDSAKDIIKICKKIADVDNRIQKDKRAKKMQKNKARKKVLSGFGVDVSDFPVSDDDAFNSKMRSKYRQ